MFKKVRGNIKLFRPSPSFPWGLLSDLKEKPTCGLGDIYRLGRLAVRVYMRVYVCVYVRVYMCVYT